MLRQLFCDHEYEVAERNERPSGWEQLVASLKEKPSHLEKVSNLEEWMFERSVAYVMRCKKCQKLKVEVWTT